MTALIGIDEYELTYVRNPSGAQHEWPAPALPGKTEPSTRQTDTHIYSAEP